MTQTTVSLQLQGTNAPGEECLAGEGEAVKRQSPWRVRRNLLEMLVRL